MASPILPKCIPLPLDDETLEDIVQKGKDWSLMHGAAMRSKNDFNPDVLQVYCLQFLLKFLFYFMFIYSLHHLF